MRAHAFSGYLAEHTVPVTPSVSQVIPIPVGDNHQVLAIAKALEIEGILAVAIRPPTVPKGTARIRLSVTLEHDLDTLRAAAATIGRVIQSELL